MNGKRHVARAAAACLAAALLAGCGIFGGGDDESPSPTSSQPKSSSPAPGKLPDPVARRVASIVAQGEPDGNGRDTYITWKFEVVVYGVYRQGENATLLLGANLISDAGKSTAGINVHALMQQTVEPDDNEDYPANDLTLVDSDALQAYLVARDAQTDGKCLCPDKVSLIATSRPHVSTAVFAAPPGDVKSIDVSTPSAGYFEDVPVTDGAPPVLDEDSDAYTVDPMESDGDPVRADVVPITGQVSNLDLSVTKTRDKVTLDANVLFEFDKATLTPKAKSRIADAAATLKQNAKGQQVQVNGYTDSKGSDSYNLSLSKRRAEAVKKALEPQLKGTGITLVAAGKGEASSVAPNIGEDGKDNPEGRALNRRVEIVYRK